MPVMSMPAPESVFHALPSICSTEPSVFGIQWPGGNFGTGRIVTEIVRTLYKYTKMFLKQKSFDDKSTCPNVKQKTTVHDGKMDMCDYMKLR